MSGYLHTPQDPVEGEHRPGIANRHRLAEEGERGHWALAAAAILASQILMQRF